MARPSRGDGRGHAAHAYVPSGLRNTETSRIILGPTQLQVRPRPCCAGISRELELDYTFGSLWSVSSLKSDSALCRKLGTAKGLVIKPHKRLINQNCFTSTLISQTHLAKQIYLGEQYKTHSLHVIDASVSPSKVHLSVWK